MAFFKRKNKKYDLSDVLDDNDFIMDFGEVPANPAEHNTKIKPAHALTARELLHQTEPAEEIPMQQGPSAAEALRSRMRPPAAPAETIAMRQEPERPAEKPAEPSGDFEQLISKLHALVKDIGNVPEDAEDTKALAQNEIDDIISIAERRARQRAQAAYNLHTTPPEETYPFYNPMAEAPEPVAPPEETAGLGAAETAAPEDIPSSTPPEAAAPQIHLATDEISASDAPVDLHATMPFDISAEVVTADEAELYGTKEYETVQPEETEDIFSAANIFSNQDAAEEDFEEEAEYPNDYTCIDDAPQLKLQLAHSIKKLGWRTGVCAVCSLLLLLLSGALLIPAPLTGFALHAARLILLVVCMLAGSNILRGILSIFKGEADMDAIAAVALLFTFAHNIYFGFVAKSAPAFWPEAAMALSLALFNYGKLVNVRRIYKNFCRIATSNVKHALHFIEKEAQVNTIVRGALDGPALICTGRRTVNLNGFFKHTYSRDPQSAVSGRLLIIAAVVAALIGVLGFTQVDAEFAFTAVTLTLTLFAAPATVLVSALPLKAAADTLEEYGATLPGYSSAYKIRNANAVAVDVADLFPKGSIKLYNMHTLSKNPVDRSLCEAAAVVMAAKSPLSEIFVQITGSLKENLPAVDSMLYEERLGLSGWVNNRRILIGNRTLMENHNVQIPSFEVDKKILAKGFFPVYIAADSKPCVLLVVGYHADDTVTYELRRLCNAGYTVMVNSCDPNTSADMLCDYFGLPEGAIKTMNADGIRTYKEETNYQESLDSAAAYEESVCGLFALATVSMRVPPLSILMLVLNIISIAVGVSAFGCMIFMGTTALLTPLLVLVYQLVSTLVIGLMPALFKP